MKSVLLLFLSMAVYAHDALPADRGGSLSLRDEALSLQREDSIVRPKTHVPSPAVFDKVKYAVKPVGFNSRGMDFSPFPFGDGLAFVSSRPAKGTPANTSGSFMSLFFAAEQEDGSFSLPELLNGAVSTTYHEGPVVFYDGGRKKIFSRSAAVNKRGDDEEAIRPLELAFSERSASGKWSEPVALPLGDGTASLAHPAISEDGTVLYFSANLPGTIGQSDLFVSRSKDGRWSAPENLGDRINTPGQELFPFLYDDHILFFASNGRGGMGGMDIFFCDLSEVPLRIASMPEPVNSGHDDFGFVLEGEGVSGFFSSNRPGGMGEDDIFFFEEIQLYADIKVYDSLTGFSIANASVTVEAPNGWARQVRTDLSGAVAVRLRPSLKYKLLASADGYYSAEVDLSQDLWTPDRDADLRISLSPRKKSDGGHDQEAIARAQRSSVTNVISFSSSPLDIDLPAEGLAESQEGEVASDTLPASSLLVIAVEVINDLPAILFVRGDTIYEARKNGASLMSCSDLGLDIQFPRGARRNDYEEHIAQQVVAQGHDVGRFVLIRSFFFDSNKSLVRNDASAQLDKIIDVMFAFPRIALEMTFHSDARGTDAFNLDLSRARSDVVTAYLKNGGISADRISSRFVGEGQLLNDCGDLSDCDELLHQINRTAEFKFIIR